MYGSAPVPICTFQISLTSTEKQMALKTHKFTTIPYEINRAWVWSVFAKLAEIVD